MTHSLILSLLIVFFLPRSAWSEEEGQIDVPNAAEREIPDSGWEPVIFEPLNLVDEITGRDFAGADLIADMDLHKRVSAREFQTLQLNNLAIRPKDAVVHNDAVKDDSWITIPFAISVKHSRKGSTLINPVQGTLEVAGELKLLTRNSHFEVRVDGFNDANAFEWMARKMGLHQGIDLKFARAIVEPVLDGYLNADSSRAENILGILNQYQPPK